MNKLLKIGVPILIAVLALVIGTGLVLAKENDTPVLTCPAISYDCDYSGCSQCPGLQYSNCPNAGNAGRWGGCGGGGYCRGAGGSYGQRGWSGDSDANYQPPCHRF
ncbi:MAG: hypothetical protein FJ023_00975 [Chloroflexi bacterium]|nr:hypothetical protein [Chloroflexota bacterium]